LPPLLLVLPIVAAPMARRRLQRRKIASLFFRVIRACLAGASAKAGDSRETPFPAQPQKIPLNPPFLLAKM
jgi:hypothetical protein